MQPPCIVCGAPSRKLYHPTHSIPRCAKHLRNTKKFECSRCGKQSYTRTNWHHELCYECSAKEKAANRVKTAKVGQVTFVDAKERQFDLDKWLEHAEAYTTLKASRRSSREEANVKIDTDRPVAVCYSSDWHLGASSVDYKQFCSNLNYLLENSSLYVVTVGDLIDNFTRFKDIMAVVDQVMSKEEQEEALSAILDRLIERNKLLAVVCGNHEWRDETLIGASFMQRMMASHKVPYFGAKGLLKLQVGEQVYTNLLAHKARFNSYLHQLHSAKRLFEVEYPAEVVVTAHTHQPAIECSYRHNMSTASEVIFVRTGTFKIGDDMYSLRGYSRGRLGVPTIVYFPDRPKKIAFMSAEDAVVYMKSL